MDICGFEKLGGIYGLSVCESESGCRWWARVAGGVELLTWAARRGPGAEGALQNCGPEGGGLWTPRESRWCLGRVAGPAGAGAREKSGG